ncbi:hypothetical protein SY88_04620 [Clostridiales bacterium PH28_bin88]|nr:hypothetical protein SY88_04620 [Clostridiales bacterium PH28_bin88]
MEPPEFGEVFRVYYPNVYRQITYLLGDQAAAEDLAQETFLRLYRSPPVDMSNLGGWLARVAANLAYNHLRAEKRRKEREARDFEETVGRVLSFDEALIRNQEIRAVRRCLSRLADRDRTCLLLKFSGFSYQEIAEVIGVQAASVGTILARAQRRFKDEFEKGTKQG